MRIVFDLDLMLLACMDLLLGVPSQAVVVVLEILESDNVI